MSDIIVPEFTEFPKIARLNRDCVISEKLDGTNAQIYILDDFTTMFVGSRTRWLDEKNDNYGFHKWCMDNKEELLKLGPGRHFGEYWGSGIQRGYNLPKGEKRFSLFNTDRWKADNTPSCCSVVPVLYSGPFDTQEVRNALHLLERNGSYAAPGYMNPEGIVVFHIHANMSFKVTIKNDAMPKSLVKEG